MTALAVAFFLLWCTAALLLVYGALRAAAKADSVMEGFDRDEGWCHDEELSGDKCLLSDDPSVGSTDGSNGVDRMDGGEG